MSYTPSTKLAMERIDQTWHVQMDILLGNGERLDLQVQLPLQEHPSPSIAELSKQVLERVRFVIEHILNDSRTAAK